MACTTSAASRRTRSRPIISRSSPTAWANCSVLTGIMANGAHGYLPTPEQHKLGGYETWIGVSKAQLDASVKMVDALVEMLGELTAKKP